MICNSKRVNALHEIITSSFEPSLDSILKPKLIAEPTLLMNKERSTVDMVFLPRIVAAMPCTSWRSFEGSYCYILTSSNLEIISSHKLRKALDQKGYLMHIKGLVKGWL
jgi:hypothetical protein